MLSKKTEHGRADELRWMPMLARDTFVGTDAYTVRMLPDHENRTRYFVRVFKHMAERDPLYMVTEINRRLDGSVVFSGLVGSVFLDSAQVGSPVEFARTIAGERSEVTLAICCAFPELAGLDAYFGGRVELVIDTEQLPPEVRVSLLALYHDNPA